METFEAVVEPANPRPIAMLMDAFNAENISIVSAPAPVEERRDAVDAAALVIASATFVVQAADSDSVHRAIASVSGRLGGILKGRVTPRHKK